MTLDQWPFPPGSFSQQFLLTLPSIVFLCISTSVTHSSGLCPWAYLTVPLANSHTYLLPPQTRTLISLRAWPMLFIFVSPESGIIYVCKRELNACDWTNEMEREEERKRKLTYSPSGPHMILCTILSQKHMLKWIKMYRSLMNSCKRVMLIIWLWINEQNSQVFSKESVRVREEETGGKEDGSEQGPMPYLSLCAHSISHEPAYTISSNNWKKNYSKHCTYIWTYCISDAHMFFQWQFIHSLIHWNMSSFRQLFLYFYLFVYLLT